MAQDVRDMRQWGAHHVYYTSPLVQNSFIEGLYPPILPLSMIMFFLSMNSFCSKNVSVLKVEILDCYEKWLYPPILPLSVILSLLSILYFIRLNVMQMNMKYSCHCDLSKHFIFWNFKVKIGPYFLLYLLPPNLPLSSNIVHFNFFNS